MFESVLNIASAVMGCLGCILVLAATISLARRRFYEPMQDKRLWIIALCLFAGAVFLFSPNKSTNRDVKAAIARVEMAARRTAYAKSAKITCVVQNKSGDTIAHAEYMYGMEGGEPSHTIDIQTGEELLKGAKALTLFEKGFADDGFTNVKESREGKTDTYHFYKNFKQIISKKRSLLNAFSENLDAEMPVTGIDKTLTEGELTNIKKQNDKLVNMYKRKLALYQWEEIYHVDDNGYLIGWEIFCEVKTTQNMRVEQHWIYTISDIEKNR